MIQETVERLKALRYEISKMDEFGLKGMADKAHRKSLESEVDECLVEIEKSLPMPIEVQLSGEDGNAFSILGRVDRAMRRFGCDEELRKEFRYEAMSGDYNHLLQTAMKWVEVL